MFRAPHYTFPVNCPICAALVPLGHRYPLVLTAMDETPHKQRRLIVKHVLREALENRGYATLTPVQEAVLDPDLQGADLLVSAQTGSGKTLGFGLAIAPVILQDAEAFGPAEAPLALVIAPTRELALQVKRELSWLYAGAGAVLASCVGGMDMRDERRALARGAHIVVATPGRLRDHIMRGAIDLGTVRSVVLDEADEMLDLGFREDLEFILGEAPDERQTLLFSATVPKSIARLAESYQNDAVRVVAKSEASQHADIEYRAMVVNDRDTEAAVINTLRFYEAPNAIVFANTRAAVNRLTTRLSNRGFHVVALSGELSQAERTHALQAMRDGRARICVATDVAARGIDLPNLDLVVHAELPNSHETLLHRSGRTGRAGRKGVSALIVARKIRKRTERMLARGGLEVEWTSAPSADAVMARDTERLFADPTWQEPVTEGESEHVTRLVATFGADQIAAAFLRLHRSMHSAPEELSDVDTQPAPRPEFGASVWFSVMGGRKAGAEPRRLLPVLCKAGGLNKDDIGAIRIQADRSFVQIRADRVDGFLAKIGADMVLEDGVAIEQLAEPPQLTHASKPRSKPQGKPAYGKKPAHAKRRTDEPAEKPQIDKPKPRRKAAEDAPKPKRDRKPTGKPKGPPPPKGKPNSKKNRARAAARAAEAKGKHRKS